MPESWNVSYAAMAVMALVGLFTVVFPLGLGLVFWRKFGGRWRFFLLGCVIFPPVRPDPGGKRQPGGPVRPHGGRRHGKPVAVRPFHICRSTQEAEGAPLLRE